MKNMLRMIFISFLIFTFIGCGDSTTDESISSDTQTTKGVVYDDLVVNLNYVTNGFNSYTNENGEFSYKDGKVDFYLGKVKIGSISSMPTDKKVFLFDMLGLQRGDYKNSKLVKLARVLQSLDTTTDDSKILLDKTKVNDMFKEDKSFDDIDIESLGITIVTSSQAKQAVKQTYINQNITPLPNIAPIANAGDDINTTENTTITLSGANSSDSDGQIVRYEWFENNELLHVGKTYTTSSLSVRTHTITLKVTDDEEAVGSDEVSITVKAKEVEPEPTPNIAPTANAGANQTVQEGTSITLDGSKSSDSDGQIVRYEWFEGTKLLGSGKTYTINSLNVGDHIITLKVTDDDGATNNDTVTIEITKIPPINKIPTANAGEDQNQIEGKDVTLDGSKSSDSDGEIVKYKWFEGAKLLGSGKTYTINSLNVGDRTITLTVTDDDGATDSDEIIVTITKADTTPPTITNTTPSDGDTNVQIDKNIVVYFDEAIKNANTTNITLSSVALTNTDIQLSSDSKSIVINTSSNLSYDTTYTLTIKTGIMDLSDNPLASEKSISFTTQAEPDTTPPTATITPDNGSANVAIDSNIIITFSEKMNASTLINTNITLTQGGASVTYAQTQSGNTLTLNPDSDFSNNTPYTLTIKDVTDIAGNMINPNPTIASFTTVPAPVVITSKLLKTGQTTCYKGNTSTEIPCTSQTADANATGQDGFYKKGVDRSYTRANDIVTDNVTGLQWQDNAEVASNRQSWTNTKTYCQNLNLHNDSSKPWRLPTIDELETIVDYGKRRGNPTESKGAIDPVFENVGQEKWSRYWSSTIVPDDTSNAWNVSFDDGNDRSSDKSNSYYVRCTR